MIKSLRTKPIRVIAIAILPLTLLGTACGSDDDGDSPANTEASDDAPVTTEASGDAPADTAGDTGDEESGANPDVEAFCDEVDAFVEEMNKVLDDPTSGDVGALATQGEELATSASELAGSVDGDDSERLQECAESLSEIGS